MLLGLAASSLGRALLAWQRELTMVSGLAITLFGLHFLGVLRIPILMREARVEARTSGGSALGAYVLGLAFAFGWTPCIGPVLGGVLTLAGTSGQLGRGVLLLSFYALGLAVPFLAAALMLESFTRFSKGFRRFLPWVERVSGAVLIVAGTMLLTGTYTALNGALIRYTPDWLWSRL